LGSGIATDDPLAMRPYVGASLVANLFIESQADKSISTIFALICSASFVFMG
jgi:hypothetical protein